MSPQKDYPEQAQWNANAEERRWNGTRLEPKHVPIAEPTFSPAAAQPPATPQPPAAQQSPAAPQPPAGPRIPTSRRSILRGVFGAGAVAAAAAVGAGAVVEFDKKSPQTLMPASKPVAMAPMAPNAMAGPLVVYIADTTTGQMNVYGGTGATQVRNPALVNQILANLKLA